MKKLWESVCRYTRRLELVREIEHPFVRIEVLGNVPRSQCERFEEIQTLLVAHRNDKEVVFVFDTHVDVRTIGQCHCKVEEMFLLPRPENRLHVQGKRAQIRKGIPLSIDGHVHFAMSTRLLGLSTPWIHFGEEGGRQVGRVLWRI